MYEATKRCNFLRQLAELQHRNQIGHSAGHSVMPHVHSPDGSTFK